VQQIVPPHFASSGAASNHIAAEAPAIVESAVLFPEATARLPDELHVEAHGRRRRVEVYWDGCAYVI
jgi:hypothetical protein